MTIAVDLGRKATKPTNNQIIKLSSSNSDDGFIDQFPECKQTVLFRIFASEYDQKYHKHTRQAIPGHHEEESHTTNSHKSSGRHFKYRN